MWWFPDTHGVYYSRGPRRLQQRSRQQDQTHGSQVPNCIQEDREVEHTVKWKIQGTVKYNAHVLFKCLGWLHREKCWLDILKDKRFSLKSDYFAYGSNEGYDENYTLLCSPKCSIIIVFWCHRLLCQIYVAGRFYISNFMYIVLVMSYCRHIHSHRKLFVGLFCIWNILFNKTS